MAPGYSLEDIAALKAVPPGDRINGISLQVRKDIKAHPAWYTWSATNTSSSDDDLVVIPEDSPDEGSWLKTNRSYQDIHPQAHLSSGLVGSFSLGRTESAYASGLLGIDAAIKINLPDNCVQFISEWALTFRDPNQAYDVRWDLSGHYSSSDFTHYLGSWLTYNYWGFYPETFGIAWFRNLRFGDNLDLGIGEDGKLNCSIVSNAEEEVVGDSSPVPFINRRELHLYNKIGFPVYLVASFTLALPMPEVSAPEDESTVPV